MRVNYDTIIIVDNSYYLKNCFVVYVRIARWSAETFISITIPFMGFSSFQILQFKIHKKKIGLYNPIFENK